MTAYKEEGGRERKRCEGLRAVWIYLCADGNNNYVNAGNYYLRPPTRVKKMEVGREEQKAKELRGSGVLVWICVGADGKEE